MLIKSQFLQHWIENFYGYGSWQARIWFIGYEEGGGDFPEEVAEKFNYFNNVHPSVSPALCDIRDLYQHVHFKLEGPRADVFSNLHDYRFGANGQLHGAWKNLIAFAHSYKGKKVPDLLKYQKNLFVLPSSNNEALIQLYPLPSTHNHAWYYSWLDLPEFPFLKTRALYEDFVYKNRIRTILENVITHKPELVLMYGMNNINTLKESVKEFFPAVKFTMVKAITQQIPQHHTADLNGVTLVITTQVPTLRHNRVESGFDWIAFGKTVSTQSR